MAKSIGQDYNPEFVITLLRDSRQVTPHVWSPHFLLWSSFSAKQEIYLIYQFSQHVLCTFSGPGTVPLEDVSAWPSRMPAGNQTFLESSAMIKIDRKGEPISQGSSSYKVHPSGAREEGQIGQVYLGEAIWL